MYYNYSACSTFQLRIGHSYLEMGEGSKGKAQNPPLLEHSSPVWVIMTITQR